MGMPDLTTTYLGLKLKSPLVVSASPLSKKLSTVRHLEEAGAAAIVMYSLFEEQILHESYELDYYLDIGSHSHAEALSYFPDLDRSVLTRALARYKEQQVWGTDPVLPEEGFDRLRRALLGSGYLSREVPFGVCVDNRFAEAAVSGAG